MRTAFMPILEANIANVTVPDEYTAFMLMRCMLLESISSWLAKKQIQSKSASATLSRLRMKQRMVAALPSPRRSTVSLLASSIKATWPSSAAGFGFFSVSYLVILPLRF